MSNAKNYLIEPDQRRMAVGQKNFLLNGKEGKFIHGYAATKHNNDDADFGGARPVYLDEFMKEEQIDRIAILHADIQGAEYEMLLSCKEAMESGKIDYFVISTHSQGLHDGCLRLLSQYGYAVIAEHSPDESFLRIDWCVRLSCIRPGPD